MTEASTSLERSERSPQQIEAEIAAARERLVGSVSALQDRVSPKSVVRRTKAGVRSQLVTDQGVLRPEVVAGLAVFAVGLAVVVVTGWRRRR